MENDFERLLKLTEDNNKILRKMRRDQIVARWLKVFYWLILIGALFGAYYFLQPYVSSFNNNLNDFQNVIRTISSSTNSIPANIPGITEMQRFLENIKSSN